MEGRVLWRRITLAEPLAAVGPAASVAGSCNLHDLLKLRDEDEDDGRWAAVTLASAMQADRRASSSPPSSSPSAEAAAAARTLLDIIRDDQPTPHPAASYSVVGAGDPFFRHAVSLPAQQIVSPPALTRAIDAPLPPPEGSPPTDQEEQQGEKNISVDTIDWLSFSMLFYHEIIGFNLKGRDKDGFHVKMGHERLWGCLYPLV